MYLGWIPNAISLLRIALIVPILMLILRGHYAWALGLFFFAGFSDGLDGYLATRFNWQTRLGGLLDPVADKLLVAGLFITLMGAGDPCLACDGRDIARCRHFRWSGRL